MINGRFDPIVRGEIPAGQFGHQFTHWCEDCGLIDWVDTHECCNESRTWDNPPSYALRCDRCGREVWDHDPDPTFQATRRYKKGFKHAPSWR